MTLTSPTARHGYNQIFRAANNGAGIDISTQLIQSVQHPCRHSQYTTYGPANCALASSTASPCRQVPDVSANADEFTPYAEYCTGSDITSYCGITLNGGGWFGIGGTSLAAPLWGALIADRDSYQSAQIFWPELRTGYPPHRRACPARHWTRRGSW